MYYIQGNNPNARFKIFEFSGKLSDAIERGKRFCEVIGARYVRVETLVSSLSAEEKRAQEG